MIIVRPIDPGQTSAHQSFGEAAIRDRQVGQQSTVAVSLGLGWNELNDRVGQKRLGEGLGSFGKGLTHLGRVDAQQPDAFPVGKPNRVPVKNHEAM